jgi:hypothetical protein
MIEYQLAIEGLERSIYTHDIFESFDGVRVERYKNGELEQTVSFDGFYRWMLAMSYVYRGVQGLREVDKRRIGM